MSKQSKKAKEFALSNEEYISIVEKSPLLILKVNREYQVTYANKTVTEKTPYNIDDLIGKNALEIGIDPSQAGRWFELYKNVFETGEVSTLESTVDIEGEQKTYQFIVLPESDEKGFIEELVVYINDVTKRRLIEDERDYIFNFSLDLFAIQDLEGRFLKLNPSWNEKLGWQIDNLVGTKWTELVHPDDSQRAINADEKLKDFNLIISHENRYQCKDGYYKWLEWNSIPIKQKNIVISVVRDITQWKQIQEQLKDSERKYRNVVEKATDIIFSTDIKGNITYANQSTSLTIGYTDEELKDMNIFDMVTLDHKERVKDHYIKQHVNEEATSYTEYPINTKEGKIVWLGQGSNLRYEGKKPVGFDSICRDVTKRIKAEEELKASERRLRKIVNSANDVILAIDKNGIISDANETAFEVLRKSKKELTGKKFENLLSEDNSRVVFNNFLKSYKNESAVKGFLKFKLEDESYLEFRTNGIEYIKNNKSYLLLFLSDITHIKRAQQVSQVLYNISRAVNLSDRLSDLYEEVHIHLKSIIDAENFAIAHYIEEENKIDFPYFKDKKDEVFVILDVDDSTSLTAKTIRTKKPILIRGKRIEEKFKSVDKAKYGSISKSWLGVPLMVNDELYGAILVQNYEKENVYSEEDVLILESVAEQIASAISKFTYRNKLQELNKDLEQRVADRTEQLEKAIQKLNYENEQRKKAQEELTEAKNELDNALMQEKELNDMKSKFISMVSHEYRTPLTVIMSSVNLLKNYMERMSAEQVDKQFKNISASVISMTQLLDDVLMIGKTENINSLNPIKLDLVNSIKSIIEKIQFIDNAKHKFELISDENLIIRTDKKLLEHILNNLISNAVKYSDDDTDILIEVNDNQSDYIISVKDNGIGIPLDDLDKIFEAFYRSDNVGSIEGTGLGMSIVKKSVDALQGKIDIESQKDKGTTITVSLPKDIENSN